jgi:hypothetical protein
VHGGALVILSKPMQATEDPKPLVANEESRPLDYRTPERFGSRTRGRWPSQRVWVASALYVLSTMTPTMAGTHPTGRHDERLMMGWQTAFASIAELPRAIQMGSGVELLELLFPPLVNLLFIAAVFFAFAAARGGPRSARFEGASQAMASFGVWLAIIGVALLLAGLWFGNAWNGGASRVSVGVLFWAAAYLVLGLRFGAGPASG